MAVGDAAKAAGYTLVPESGGDSARVRYGAREINRTRDFVAGVKNMLATTKAGWCTKAGISSGTANPSGGSNGDIYIKIL